MRLPFLRVPFQPSVLVAKSSHPIAALNSVADGLRAPFGSHDRARCCSLSQLPRTAGTSRVRTRRASIAQHQTSFSRRSSASARITARRRSKTASPAPDGQVLPGSFASGHTEDNARRAHPWRQDRGHLHLQELDHGTAQPNGSDCEPTCRQAGWRSTFGRPWNCAAYVGVRQPPQHEFQAVRTSTIESKSYDAREKRQVVVAEVLGHCHRR
jgi:hypothetical protein